MLKIFLDWCPFGSASADLEADHAVSKRFKVCKDLSQEIGRRLLGDANINMSFAFRHDGLILIAFDAPNSASYLDLIQSAREISFEVKKRVFKHDHAHHHDPVRREFPGNRWFGRRTKTPLRLGHEPVEIECPDDFFANGNDIKRQTRAYLNLSDTDRPKTMQEEFLKDSFVAGLHALPSRKISRITALYLLDDFISALHDHAHGYMRNQDKDYKSKRLRNLLLSGLVIFLSFLALEGLVKGLIIVGIDDAIVNITSALVACAFGIITHSWIDEISSRRIQTGLHCYIGYLNRANDFSCVLTSIFSSHNPQKKKTSFRGYDSLIGSLQSMLATVSHDAERRRSVHSAMLVALGVLAAALALVGIDLQANMSDAAQN